MSVLWSLFAGAMMAVAAEPANYPGRWITHSDYPSAALRQEQQGYVLFSLTLSREGKIERCDVTGSSGSEALDAITCALLFKRARFRPARDDAGLPIATIYSNVMSWLIPSNGKVPKPSHEDLLVEVERLPQGMKSPAKVTVDLIVDATGQIENCNPKPSEPTTALGFTACEQAVAQLRTKPAIDSKGGAMRSLQHAVVTFTAISGNSP